MATFVDKTEHVLGVYSILTQLRKFGMIANTTNTNTSTTTSTTSSLDSSSSSTVTLLTITTSAFISQQPKEYEALRRMVPSVSDIHIVDPDYIHDKLLGRGMWTPTFNKLWMFNETEFME